MKINVKVKGLNFPINGSVVINTSDQLGTILVIDYPAVRVLSFDSGYEQSGYSMEKPYAVVHEYIRGMMLAVGFITPTHATILGLGGGSLLRSLHFFLPQCHFEVVELRPKVYELAKYYFDIPIDERVNVTIADAKSHLKKMADTSTNIIFSDLFDAYTMSPIQAQKEFVEECWRVLSKEGWLIINYHQLPHTDSIFFNALVAHFCKIFVFPVSIGNYILYACKSPHIDVAEALPIIAQLEATLDTPFVSLFEKVVERIS